MAITIDELKRNLQEYLELSARIKELTKSRDKIKELVKGEMGDTLYLQAGNLAAVIVPQDRKTLNAELIAQEMQAEGKEIPEHWWRITPSDRFMVKEIVKRDRKSEESGS